MLNKIVYLIGCFSWLALVACSSGTIDPNANPFAYADQSSSSFSSSSDPESTGTKDELGDSVIYFTSKVSQTIEITVVTYKGNSTSVVTKGHIAVYDEEKGASAVCGDSRKSYSAKFKLGQNHRIEKTLELKNYGVAACDSLYKVFSSLCKTASLNDQLSGACDENGELELYCAYSNENSDFENLLNDFTSESESVCRGSGFELYVQENELY